MLHQVECFLLLCLVMCLAPASHYCSCCHRDGCLQVRLAVAGAFHTQYMAPAAEKLQEALNNTNIVTPRIPVISNVDAQPHSDPATIKAILAQQVWCWMWLVCCNVAFSVGDAAVCMLHDCVMKSNATSRCNGKEELCDKHALLLEYIVWHLI